jgi:phosphate transport system protein
MEADDHVSAYAESGALRQFRKTGMSQSGGDPVEGHTLKSVDQALTELRARAVEMGGLVIDQVGTAVQALLERDMGLADLVLSRESMIDDYELRLDRDSLNFVALHQPVANDLRAARAIARAAVELERVGDESKKIARFAVRVGATSTSDPVTAVARYLRHMAGLSSDMLRSAVRALDEASPELAREVLVRDRELDAEFATALRQLMSFVMQDHQFMRATIDTVFALKGLERIGDHAKNIAEQVLYMVEGVRPTKTRKDGKERGEDERG